MLPRWFAFLTPLVACAQPVSTDLCSEDFRDHWWQLPQEASEGLYEGDFCFMADTESGLLYSVEETWAGGESHGSVYDPEEWECVGPNEYRVKNAAGLKARLSTERLDADLWFVDFKAYEVINHEAEVFPCEFNEDYIWPWDDGWDGEEWPR